MDNSYEFAKYANSKIDCVYLTSEQLKDLNSIALSNNKKFNRNIKNGFLLNEIVVPKLAVIINSGEMVITYEPINPVADCDKEWMVSMSKNDDCIVGIMNLENGLLRSGVIKSTLPVEENKIIGLCCIVFSAIQDRLLNPEDNFEIEEKKVKKKSFGKKSKRKGQRKVRLFKSYTLIRTEPVIRKSHRGPMSCPCWGVRGHYRHYQSGKVVFIAAYQKGKDRSKYAPKEYVIVRKESDHEDY